MPKKAYSEKFENSNNSNNDNDIQEVLKTFLQSQQETNERLSAAIEDHEVRLKKLEADSQQPKPAPQQPIEATAQQSAEESAKKDAAQAINGIGYAYKYWVPSCRTWFITADIWAAKQASNGLYNPIWALYKDGAIDHELTAEEIQQYCP